MIPSNNLDVGFLDSELMNEVEDTNLGSIILY
jgi:hypothetical protein